MRFVLAALLILLPTIALAQETKPPEPEQKEGLAYPITREQIRAIPPKNWKPKITLQRALNIAERYIKKMRFDISSSYLSEARLIPNEFDEGYHWQFRWVEVTKGIGNHIKITVSMEGQPQVLSSP